MKFRIAHLSDPHFGTVLEPVRKALLNTLHELKPELVLISGDITQRARRAQFRAARSFCDALQPIPVFAVPGNHDIPLFNFPGRLLAPYRGFHRHFQTKRERIFRLGELTIFGLNSTSRWRHVQGKLDTNRLREQLLAPDEARVRIAMIHHPLSCRRASDDKNRLRGREEIFDLFRQAKIDLVLSGHVHDPFVAEEEGLLLSVAGTCLSWRTRKDAPNSFHWIEIQTAPKRIEITRYDLGRNQRYQPVPNA